MTICAAVSNHGSIIIVSDTKLTFFGGSISAEGIADKQRMVNDDWEVLFAGDVSTLTPMLEAIVETGKKVGRMSLRQFARLCAKTYREERERIIEDEILPEYDIATYNEYLSLKLSDPKLFEAIASKIEEAQEKWQLLFCGFDRLKHPHLFVISGRGKIEYCDTQSFAAIGSGAWAAYVALASYPYRSFLNQDEAAYCLLAAKFAAESAEGVGEQTNLVVMDHDNHYSSLILQETVDLVTINGVNCRECPKRLQRK